MSDNRREPLFTVYARLSVAESGVFTERRESFNSEQDDFVSFDQQEPVFVQKRRVGIGRLRLGQEGHHRGALARPALLDCLRSSRCEEEAGAVEART